jgi:hypothetical protein
VGPVRRLLAAAALSGAVTITVVSLLSLVASPPHGQAAAVGRGAPDAMPDRAALVSLRGIAAIGAQQARTLRAVVHGCAARTARGPCVTMALAHAAAGARLNAVLLRAIAARLPEGPCLRVAGRLAALMATLGFLGVDGSRGAAWHPEAAWAAARAASRVASRVLGVHDAAWPRHCTRIGGGLRA